MAHPNLLATAESGELRIAGRVKFERGEAEFAFHALGDDAAQQMRHELLAVADAEDRLAAAENGRVDRGTFRIVHAARPAGNNQAFGGSQLARRRLTGAYLGIDTEIANLARDQVTVLPAGIENQNLWLGIQITIVARMNWFAVIAHC